MSEELHAPPAGQQTNFFGNGSPYLGHPLLTPERAIAEVDFALHVLEVPAGARLLDVGCGFGRHAIELARRGYRVTGVDPAAAMIAAARRAAAAAEVSVAFRQLPVEALTPEIPYDAAICLFTTLGQIPDGSATAADNGAGLAAQVRRLLPVGAPFLVEVPQRSVAVARLKPAEQFGAGLSYTAVHRRYDPATHAIRETFDVVSGDQVSTYHLAYRVFSPEELAALLQAAGFRLRAVYGADPSAAPGDPCGPSLRPLGPQDPLMRFLVEAA